MTGAVARVPACAMQLASPRQRRWLEYRSPPISSTKSLTGHSLGAAGVQEAIYCLPMMRDGFLAGAANIDQLDPACSDYPILRETHMRRVDTVMSNSFGFGGTNATLVFQRY
jgi:3-oxoacyl-[acyl-carrier-protein] synthase-1